MSNDQFKQGESPLQQMLLEQLGKRLVEHEHCNPYYEGTPQRVRSDWRRKLDFEVGANLGK